MDLLQQAADERGITISELIRNAALASVQDGQASTVEEVQKKARELVRVASRLQA